MKLGNPRPILLLAYIAVIILASAGAINYGYTYGVAAYIVGGILNLVCGAIVTYQLFKKRDSK